MSTVATTHKDRRPAAVPTPGFPSPGSTHSLLIAWVLVIALASLALVLL
ncbi:MAG: hypothetical protein HOQ36_11440 [Nocardia sp.]|nr:hypothetical protein [Nocardia sp.]NUS93008.1 hypothetical protein [Nocardia sp.]